jgi:glycosyltransferase involved in cell wall biosynthesis
MHLSIIIPAYNEAKRLPGTLTVLAAGQAALAEMGVKSECLVVDNNSTDATAAVAQAAGLHVISEPINQIARARNTGARAAVGEWLLFLDADSHPPIGLWQDLARIMKETSVIGGGSVLRLDGHHFLFGLALKFWNSYSRLFREAAGAFLFCRRSAFIVIDGFDETFFAGEEIDFCRRLKRHARPLRQRLVILADHPLVTSARKAELYTTGEFLRFFARTILARGRTLRKREDCPIWYDGRR